MFKLVGQHVPPDPGVPPPLQWGTNAGVEALLGTDCDLNLTRRTFAFRFRSAEAYFETFKQFYGPVAKTWAALDDADRTSLRDQLFGLANDHNWNERGALTVDAEYLEVVATRR